MTELISTALAAVAILISFTIWQVDERSRRLASRRADVTVYFHSLQSRAVVSLSSGLQVEAGYHL